MEFLHTMIRVTDLDASLDFFVRHVRTCRNAADQQRKGPLHPGLPCRAGGCRTGEKNQAPLVELTHNWDPEVYTGGRNFGHLAYRVDDIYAFCQKLRQAGVTINRPPRDGHMAFVRTPDNISIELIQKGDSLPPAEPWLSMPNTGAW